MMMNTEEASGKRQRCLSTSTARDLAYASVRQRERKGEGTEMKEGSGRKIAGATVQAARIARSQWSTSNAAIGSVAGEETRAAHTHTLRDNEEMRRRRGAGEQIS